MHLSPVFPVFLLQLLSINGVIGWEPVNPLVGFQEVPLNESNLEIQWPYNVHVKERYSFVNGVHKLRVLRTDKPHSPTSNTSSRTEIRIRGYDYSSGVWQFEGHGFVPSGTTGVCIMQVFGAAAFHATTLMMRVYDYALKYYKNQVVLPCVYDKWFRLNVIHNVDANKLQVYIDGYLKLEVEGRGGTSHYFKCGVYAQDNASYYMESRWKGIKVLKKCD